MHLALNSASSALQETRNKHSGLGSLQPDSSPGTSDAIHTSRETELRCVWGFHSIHKEMGLGAEKVVLDGDKPYGNKATRGEELAYTVSRPKMPTSCLYT